MLPVDTLRSLFVSAVTLLPEGGQRTARQNAWAAMGEDALRIRDRREADAALAALVPRVGAAVPAAVTAPGELRLPH